MLAPIGKSRSRNALQNIRTFGFNSGKIRLPGLERIPSLTVRYELRSGSDDTVHILSLPLYLPRSFSTEGWDSESAFRRGLTIRRVPGDPGICQFLNPSRTSTSHLSYVYEGAFPYSYTAHITRPPSARQSLMSLSWPQRYPQPMPRQLLKDRDRCDLRARQARAADDKRLFERN